MIIEELAAMEYPGRGILIGKTPDKNRFATYFLTGRKPSSQARKLVGKTKTLNTLRVAPTDIDAVNQGDPNLLTYMAMFAQSGRIGVSNGAHTQAILNSCYDTEHIGSRPGVILERAFRKPTFQLVDGGAIDLAHYEPDPPYNTSRISGYANRSEFALYINWEERGRNQHACYTQPFEPGTASMITTYSGKNQDPPPPFLGLPLSIEIPWDDIEDINNAVYNSLGDFAIGAATIFDDEIMPYRTIKNRHGD